MKKAIPKICIIFIYSNILAHLSCYETQLGLLNNRKNSRKSQNTCSYDQEALVIFVLLQVLKKKTLVKEDRCENCSRNEKIDIR
jgi:hypothetical protein